jgi:hypothetical protein
LGSETVAEIPNPPSSSGARQGIGNLRLSVEKREGVIAAFDDESSQAALSTDLTVLAVVSGVLTTRAEDGRPVSSLRSALMALDTRGWLDKYTAALGSPPITDDDVETLLALAGVAAHASERTAAPVSCYLAARAGVPLADALATARHLADEIAAGDPPGAS